MKFFVLLLLFCTQALAGSTVQKTVDSLQTSGGLPLPVASGGTGSSSTPSNGQLLIGNGTGFTAASLGAGTANVSTSVGAGSLSVSVAVGANQVQDVFYGNGSSTSATLSFTPTNTLAVVCHQDGTTLFQGATNDYTISSTTITWVTAPPTGSKLMCNYNKY